MFGGFIFEQILFSLFHAGRVGGVATYRNSNFFGLVDG
ncbi:porin, partial [Escherichia coli]